MLRYPNFPRVPMGRYTFPLQHDGLNHRALQIRMVIEGWTRLLFFLLDENSKVGERASSPLLFNWAKINRVETEHNELI